MREQYNNGDPVSLGNCDGCQMVSINGVACHECGCPDAWRDYQTTCVECGGEFWPEEKGDRLCSESCVMSYFGVENFDLEGV